MYKHLFQQSYDNSELPSTWLTATICPVYKKGAKDLPSNYRPVSLTAIPCKLFEHIISSKIWEHLNHHNIITSKQHGFRGGMSCETQLIESIHDWSQLLDKGPGQVDVILLDFSKAFDVVPHQRLLSKLHSYGITNNTSNWIMKFLTQRTQSVVVNGSTSKEAPVTSGVPQGTVLGPLLFLIYINDIEDNLICPLRLFADDSAIYRGISCLQDALQLQKDLIKLQKWAALWQMQFNVSKCKMLRITHKKKPIDFTYTMYQPLEKENNILIPEEIITTTNSLLSVSSSNNNFAPLESITSDKYLGVILDNKLSFNLHVDYIINKATKLLNLCRRNLHMCNQDVKQTAYNTLVRPHLEYASSAWCPHTKCNIDKIEAVQRRAARFTLNYYQYGPDAGLTNKITEELKWLPLQHRRALTNLSNFYKIKNHLVNVSLPTVIVPSGIHVHHYIQVPTRLNCYKYSFFPATIRMWNQLPETICTSPSLESFKTSTSRWITGKKWVLLSGTNTWTLM